MEDDWASPWADAHDRSPTEVIKKLDARDDADDTVKSGGDEPERRVPDGNAAVHANDPWGGGEHGFGDTSAWASPSPAVRPGEVPTVGRGAGLPRWDEPVGVEIPSFVVGKAADEERPLNAIRDTVQQAGTEKPGEWFGDGVQKASLNLPTTTDEADIWAAGSDWGDTKLEKTEEVPLDKGVSPKIAPENIPLPESDTLIEGIDEAVPTQKSSEDQFINSTDHEPTKHEIITNANEEPADSRETSIEDVPPLFGLGIDVGDGVRQGRVSEENPEAAHGGGGPKEEVEGEEDSDDDFGDFADEEDFEDAQENLPEETTVSISELPPLPPTPRLRPDITFDIQTSLVNKLYPIFTTYPKPPPIEEELIYSTDSRKAWYRLSQSSTIRKDRSGDDDYVRVTWHGSKVQEDVGKIVARWMAEDRNSGSGVALGGSRRLGAMFGWGEQKTVPAPLNLLKGGSSSISGLGLGGQGAGKSPSGMSTTTMTPPAESGVAPSSPQAASFGWSSFEDSQPTVKSSHPGSSSTGHSRIPSQSLAAVGEDKPPSPSSRVSSNGTQDPSGISSQPATPGGSTKSNSPIYCSHSRQPSHTHSVAPTQPSSPQSIQRSTEVVETTLVTEARTNISFPSTPTVPKPVDRVSGQMSAPASPTNFDEWRTFENMATTVKLPSAKEANCDFDEWGAFDDSTKAKEPKIANSKTASSVGAQDQIPDLPVKIPETEETVIGSKEDEWSAFEEPGTAPKATCLDTPPARPPLQTPAKLENKRKTDDRSSLAASRDSLAASLPSEQPLTHAHIKSTENSSKTDDWGSFDAFEGAPTPSILAPLSTDITRGSIAKPIETSGSKVPVTDNWGLFGVFESKLTPQPAVSNQPPRTSTVQPGRPDANPPDKPIFSDQKVDPWSSFITPQGPRSKTAGNSNLPTLSILSGTAVKPVPRVSSAPAVVEDDDDDWGEMVQSPQVPDGGFGSVLRPTSSTPRTISPVPPQFAQAPSLQPTSTMSTYNFSSFETKTPTPERSSKPTNGGGADTWDLSFFDGPVASNKAPVNVAASNERGNDLWDAPVPVVVGRRMNAREVEEDGIVREIVDGLPDLGYMLQQM